MSGILEELELATGGSIYVQITESFGGSARGSLSVDTPNQQHTFWLSLDDLESLSALITKAVKEQKNGKRAKTPTTD